MRKDSLNYTSHGLNFNDKASDMKSAISCNCIEVIKTNEGCATITFEGGGNRCPIPNVNVGFTIVKFPNWLTCIDSESGGTGNFANEPSPSTIAFWAPHCNDVLCRDIIFCEPVCKVCLFYASYVNVSLSAYNENNELLGTVSGNANWNQGPGGDPCGCFNKWDPLCLTFDCNVIKRIRICGRANQTLIDNLTICVCCRGLVVNN